MRPSPSSPVPSSAAPTSLGPARGRSRPATLAYPNGGSLSSDPTSCKLTKLQDTIRWTRPFAPCDGLLEIAIAPDSVAAVRTPSALIGIAPDGSEAWHAAVPGIAASLATPATTKDSLVVLAQTPTLVVAYKRGEERWRLSLPATEPLVAPPVGNQTEGVLVTTVRGVHALGADGTARWTSFFDVPVRAPEPD